MNPSHLVANNQLTLLKNGEEYFPQLRAAIDAAQHTIYFETYIFAADETGRGVATALQNAALRGVIVHLLLDGFGSAKLPASWLDELQRAGVQVLWFRREISPFTLRRNRTRRLRRLHRKMAVIDRNIAFVGGINILDDVRTDGDVHAPRLDFAVRVQGRIALEVHTEMAHLWGVVSWAMLRRRAPLVRLAWLRHLGVSTAEITLLLRDNLRHRRDIERAYLSAIAHAQQEIILAHAYFLPGRILLRALVNAAQRGVKVVLLLQGKVEYRLQHYATRALYRQLLAAGVEIHEYQTSYLHAKVAVVDGMWATVGSSNLDPFSLLLAREANLAVRDAAFASSLRLCLLAAMRNDSVPIASLDRESSGWFRQLLWRASYAVIRLLMGVLGYSKL